MILLTFGTQFLNSGLSGPSGYETRGSYLGSYSRLRSAGVPVRPILIVFGAEARKLEYDHPQAKDPEKKENHHRSSYVHIPSFLESTVSKVSGRFGICGMPATMLQGPALAPPKAAYLSFNPYVSCRQHHC